MKARKRNSNDEWQEVQYVQLKDSYVITQADQMEFQYDNFSTDEEKHWQDVREKAAIAAMQGMLSNPELVDAGFDYRITIEQAAVGYADALIKQLKHK